MELGLNIAALHCWKQLPTLSNCIAESEKLVLLAHDRVEMNIIAHFLTNLHAQSILYISVTKSARVIQEGCRDLAAQMHVVDCVTGGVFKTIERPNCSYASAPYSLFELETLLTNMMDAHPSQYVVFDSLSQFVDGVAVGAQEFSQFCEHLSQLGPSACKIFLCDESSRLMRVIPRSRFSSILGLEVIYD